ncbi:Spermidine/putrescine-binding protein [Desulfotomaculum arcticum]|uniref:Spermidine/putrescine-binding protein n=1 Tax=Desulfotruncus arcticus DSM 17038 TaxID=1121424 RepID=A0A1I2QT01_9FIRM|nr:spermidine/putrescine ABC transporter substrate-binding protein [Desulfotruncus arcticus]SFG28761.1 Spermidine/putrescine-binding protein [Desulfotomaculum arcticum] [Desulfotruncus arcticus DSM 17038]
MKKKVWFLAGLMLVLALCIGLAGCGSGSGGTEQTAGQEEEKVLNVFNWSEYLPQEVIDNFQEETGIKVNYTTFSSQEEMIAKIEAGGADYDVIVPTNYTVEGLVQRDMLRKLDLSKIPHIQDIGPEYLDQAFDPGNQYTVPYMAGTTSICVNTDKVKKEITSWNDLWDPAFKNQIVLLDDPRDIIGMTLMSMGYSVNDNDPAVLDKAKDKLKELVPLVKAFDSDSPKTLFISNEVSIGVIYNGEAALAMEENPNITYVYPKEGCIRWMDTMAIPKDARHPNNAHQFIDYILSPEAGAKIAEAFPYAVPSKEAYKLLPESKRNNIASYAPDDALKNGEFENDLGETAVLYDQIWSEIKM